ncbi:MAG: hypothetical protein IJD92_01495 [Bacilli bacterium]|nr:hypothetical protein [Bacilli bacterium]
MSSFEYNDLFIKCQKYAPYHMFTFDIKDSKKMDKKTRLEAQYKLINLAKLNYKVLELIEKQTNKKILLRLENNSNIGFSFYDPEQLVIGDLTYFIIYRNSMKREEVLEIFNFCKKILDINFEFHYADGYYETNDWCEGKTKYFRGYCLQTLSELHKPYNDKLRKTLKKTN